MNKQFFSKYEEIIVSFLIVSFLFLTSKIFYSYVEEYKNYQKESFTQYHLLPFHQF